MASVLGSGGVIVLLVPAFQALYGPIDRLLGHHRRYNRTSIRRLAQASGLRVRSTRYMNFAGFFGWWVNARILRRRVQSEARLRSSTIMSCPWLRAWKLSSRRPSANRCSPCWKSRENSVLIPVYNEFPRFRRLLNGCVTRPCPRIAPARLSWWTTAQPTVQPNLSGNTRKPAWWPGTIPPPIPA